jgi:hypothetical protein
MAGERIDASGALPDGTSFEGADGLRQALLSSDLFVTTMTEKLLTYALGRGLEHFDMPAVRAIVGQAALADYRFTSFITGIVESTPFRMRRSAPDERPGELARAESPAAGSAAAADGTVAAGGVAAAVGIAPADTADRPGRGG